MNIDTVVISFQIKSTDIINLDGWRKTGKTYTKKTKIAYYRCDTKNYFLNIQLSLSKLQNGSNEKGYNFYNAFELIDVINGDIRCAIQSDSLSIQNGKVSRIDLNSDFIFKSEEDADEFIRFLNSVNLPRMKKKVIFKSGFSVCSESKNNIESRAYRKDKDPALPKSIRKNMKTTVRVEFQFLKSKKIRKFFGSDYPVKIMLNPGLAYAAWNSMLEKYRLDAAIYSRKQFFKVAKEIFNVRNTTFEKYKKILKKGWKNEELNISEKRIFQKITRELYLCGITPAYCNVSVSLVEKLSMNFFKKILRKVFFKINEINNRNKKRNNALKSFKNHCFFKYKRLDSS